MEQPTILTDDEVNRLSEIRRTHECPVRCSKEDPPAVLAEMARIRHKQRGELLEFVDKLLAGVAELKRGVTNSDIAWQHAHNLAAQCDRLNADNAKLKNDNGELRCINQSLRAEVRTIKRSDLSRYSVEIKPEYYQAEFKPGLGTVVTHFPNEVMSLEDLVKRYNQIAAAMADNGKG